jgi:hypothetical protein
MISSRPWKNRTLFKEVKPEGVTQQARGGRVRSQFRVTLVLPEEQP